ncbi:MAG: hypothetical protein FGM15_06355 [Chthoniobacterales bacterium]|nr:hypothetical protein [Chthoniobacterales bacterium]
MNSSRPAWRVVCIPSLRDLGCGGQQFVDWGMPPLNCQMAGIANGLVRLEETHGKNLHYHGVI